MDARARPATCTTCSSSPGGCSRSTPTPTTRIITSARCSITSSPRSTPKPYWVADGFAVSVNGERVATAPAPDRRRVAYDWPVPVSSYVEVKRAWKSGDVLEVTLPKSLHLEPLPDNPRRASVMWGPLVLAGDLGPEGARGAVEGEALDAPAVTPVFVTDGESVAGWLKPSGGEPGRFRSDGVGREPDAAGRPRDVELMPFYRLHRRTYSTYWDHFTTPEWEAQKAAYAAEAERQRKLEAATVASLQPGDTASERQFSYQAGDRSFAQRILGRSGRVGATWFSYNLPVDPAHPASLVVTYYSGDRRGTPARFAILVDGERVADQELRFADPMRFFDVEYPVPARLVQGKRTVTVRFQAADGGRIATLFGLRMIRGDAPR